MLQSNSDTTVGQLTTARSTTLWHHSVAVVLFRLQNEAPESKSTPHEGINRRRCQKGDERLLAEVKTME